MAQHQRGLAYLTALWHERVEPTPYCTVRVRVRECVDKCFINLHFQLANSAPKLNQRNNISQPALAEYDSRRRDSIPEEADEDKLVPAKPLKTKSDNLPPPPTYDEATRETRKSWHSDDSTPT